MAGFLGWFLLHQRRLKWRGCAEPRPGWLATGAVVVLGVGVFLAQCFTLATVLAEQPAEGQGREAGAVYQVPDGWQVVPATTDGLVHWPVVGDWDAEGRLVVVESGGVGRPIEQHNQQLVHRIVRLVDTDRDGRFDQRLVAADKLPFTEGVLCLGNTILAAAPPVIWKLTDGDGDGVCELREKWFDAGTITGCANDLHGPYLGRDGWVYWCKGAFAEQEHRLVDMRVLKDRAAHIYRRRLSGGDLDLVISGGMDNPVEVAMTPSGDLFFTSTFLVHPGNGLRDGIGHAVLGGVFGKPHGVLNDVPQTGPLLEPMVHLGAAAPSGLLAVETPRLSGALRAMRSSGSENDAGERGAIDSWLVAALFNTHKVTAHALRRAGSSYRADSWDVLVSDRVDFHPTDVIEDADGSLLVIDTGGWYDLCCPTSRVDQHIAAGGILRLVPPAKTEVPGASAQTGAPANGSSDAAGQGSATGGGGPVAGRLADPRPWVRRSALLSQVGGPEGLEALLEAIEAVANDAAARELRRRAAWALVARGDQAALDALTGLLADRDGVIVEVACHGLGLHRYRPSVDALMQLCEQSEGVTRRKAIEALGLIAAVHPPVRADVVSVLLKAAEKPRRDRWLEHAIVYALRSCHDGMLVAAAIGDRKGVARILGYRALAEMQIERSEYIELTRRMLTSGDADAEAEAVAAMRRHPEWAAELLPLLDGAWQRGAFTGAAGDDWADLLRAWRERPEVAQWAAGALGEVADAGKWSDGAARLVRAWAGSAPPVALREPLAKWLNDRPQQAWDVLEQLDLRGAAWQSIVEILQQQAIDHQGDEDWLRVLAAMPQGVQQTDAAWIDELNRRQAWQLASKFVWSKAGAEAALRLLPKAGPMALPHWMRVVVSAGDEQLVEQMLRMLPTLPAARTLPDNEVVSLVRGCSRRIQELAQEVEKTLRLPPADVEAEVRHVLQQLPAGDALRGLHVFRSTRAACSACHQLGYIGGRIGPELTRIGRTRTREALLEAILFPSARIEQSYVPMQVLTEDGRVINGLVVKEDAERLWLQVAADRQEVVLRDEIIQQRPGTTSIMPAGLDKVLSKQELADLLELLEAAR